LPQQLILSSVRSHRQRTLHLKSVFSVHLTAFHLTGINQFCMSAQELTMEKSEAEYLLSGVTVYQTKFTLLLQSEPALVRSNCIHAKQIHTVLTKWWCHLMKMILHKVLLNCLSMVNLLRLQPPIRYLIFYKG